MRVRRRSTQPRRHRVAIIGTRGYPSYYGGFETAVRKLAPHLADQGWDVDVYGRADQIKSDDPGRDLRVRSVTTPGIDSTSASTLSFGLTSCLHAAVTKPDVALVMNVANGFWLPLLKARGIPTVVNVDGIEWQREKWGKLAKAMFRWGAKFTARFADHLIFDAEAIGDFWQREFGRSGTFIPYGGDASEPLPVHDDLVSGEYVLAVARFVPENTVAEFIEACQKICVEYDVVLVGSAPEGDPLREAAQRLASQNPRFKWLGHLSDDRKLFSLWQHCGVYFHGHSVGGTNPALVQAMTLGAPVVARDTVYNREVLNDSGHFCSPTPDDIASAVLEHMPRDSNASQAVVARASEHYTWEAVCDRYDSALKTALRR